MTADKPTTRLKLSGRKRTIPIVTTRMPDPRATKRNEERFAAIRAHTEDWRLARLTTFTAAKRISDLAATLMLENPEE